MNIVELLSPKGAQIFTGPNIESNLLQITEYGITGPNMPCYQIRLHSPVSCLQYVRQGSGIIIVDDRMYQVSAGDTFLLCEGTDQIYYSNPDNQFERIWVNFKGSFTRTLISLYGIDGVIVFSNTNTDLLIQKVFSLCNQELSAEVWQDQIERQFLEMVQHLAKNRNPLPVIDENVERIRLYIDRHITDNIKLSDLSNSFSFTREHIVRAFKKTYNITPHQYILQSKIRIAMLMLIEGQQSIDEISDYLNFSAPQHFSSAFLKYTGFRPSAYREKHRNAHEKTKK